MDANETFEKIDTKSERESGPRFVNNKVFMRVIRLCILYNLCIIID